MSGYGPYEDQSFLTTRTPMKGGHMPNVEIVYDGTNVTAAYIRRLLKRAEGRGDQGAWDVVNALATLTVDRKAEGRYESLLANRRAAALALTERTAKAREQLHKDDISTLLTYREIHRLVKDAAGSAADHRAADEGITYNWDALRAVRDELEPDFPFAGDRIDTA